MATFSIEKVPTAFKSQQPPFFFGGSQVPETLLSSGLSLDQPSPAQKKRKISHYFKKKPEVIDLVSDSDDEDFPMWFQGGKLMTNTEYKNYIKNRKKNIYIHCNE